MTLKERLELLKKQVDHVRSMCCVLAKERKAQFQNVDNIRDCDFCDFYRDFDGKCSGCVFKALMSEITLQIHYSPELFNREIGELLTKIGG